MSGYICVVQSCSPMSTANMALFHFPKDKKRHVCLRKDEVGFLYRLSCILLSVSGGQNLAIVCLCHNSTVCSLWLYVCSLHFEDNMYASNRKKGYSSINPYNSNEYLKNYSLLIYFVQELKTSEFPNMQRLFSSDCGTEEQR